MTAEEALRQASDIFHKILSSHAADRMLRESRHKLPTNLYELLTAECLTADQVGKLAIEGFETCVLALHAMGAKDVTIHHCNPSE